MRICSAHFKWNDFTTTFSKQCSHTHIDAYALARLHSDKYCTNPSKFSMHSQFKSKQILYSLRYALATQKKNECLLFKVLKVFTVKVIGCTWNAQEIAYFTCKHGAQFCLRLFDALLFVDNSIVTHILSSSSNIFT